MEHSELLLIGILAIGIFLVSWFIGNEVKKVNNIGGSFKNKENLLEHIRKNPSRITYYASYDEDFKVTYLSNIKSRNIFNKFCNFIVNELITNVILYNQNETVQLDTCKHDCLYNNDHFTTIDNVYAVDSETGKSRKMDLDKVWDWTILNVQWFDYTNYTADIFSNNRGSKLAKAFVPMKDVSIAHTQYLFRKETMNELYYRDTSIKIHHEDPYYVSGLIQNLPELSHVTFLDDDGRHNYLVKEIFDRAVRLSFTIVEDGKKHRFDIVMRLS